MTTAHKPTPAVASFLAREHQLLIGGEWLEACSDKRIEVLNPADKKVISSVAEAGSKDVDRAVEAARKAFDLSLIHI